MDNFYPLFIVMVRKISERQNMKIYFEASQETYAKSNTSYVGQTDKQMYASKSPKGKSGISVQLCNVYNVLS